MNCQVFQLVSSLVMSNCRTGEMKEEFTMFANLARKDLRYVNYNLLLTELKSF